MKTIKVRAELKAVRAFGTESTTKLYAPFKVTPSTFALYAYGLRRFIKLIIIIIIIGHNYRANNLVFAVNIKTAISKS